MSNCTGCYHEKESQYNPKAPECQICLRNPEYPSKKLPEMARIEGILLEVPKDMYITKDRKKFEERLLKFKITQALSSRKVKPLGDRPPPLLWPPWIDWKLYLKKLKENKELK